MLYGHMFKSFPAKATEVGGGKDAQPGSLVVVWYKGHISIMKNERALPPYPQIDRKSLHFLSTINLNQSNPHRKPEIFAEFILPYLSD